MLSFGFLPMKDGKGADLNMLAECFSLCLFVSGRSQLRVNLEAPLLTCETMRLTE
jgi:hypothetical protein